MRGKEHLGLKGPSEVNQALRHQINTLGAASRRANKGGWRGWGGVLLHTYEGGNKMSENLEGSPE